MVASEVATKIYVICSPLVELQLQDVFDTQVACHLWATGGEPSESLTSCLKQEAAVGSE